MVYILALILSVATPQLIQQTGSDKFVERQTAIDLLKEKMPDCIPDLRKQAIENKDKQIRENCRLILEDYCLFKLKDKAFPSIWWLSNRMRFADDLNDLSLKCYEEVFNAKYPPQLCSPGAVKYYYHPVLASKATRHYLADRILNEEITKEEAYKVVEEMERNILNYHHGALVGKRLTSGMYYYPPPTPLRKKEKKKKKK